ncbi:MAG: type II toxin-antitoxin system mRNA interferase toxin, RelE/StbE family [Candidatus Blackburnbacteria bacterium]|nr:type II toxin-antitoxin system mRNA interferase toxin, RelE/StbE family [Candidatus Blackburnbacteria bacterium]
MRVTKTTEFNKSYKERIAKDRRLVQEFVEALEVFSVDPTSPILKDHALTGSMHGYRSFQVGEDFLVVYFIFKEGIILYDIGSHDQVYRR